jgi:pseudouridylate synthase
MAGIGVFATGGIGGVHRGAEATFDVSADLMELGRTPVAVVCAGVKSILDIPKTLEVLETQGVTVLGLNCQKFPSFFTASSEYDVPNTVATPEEAAKVFVAMRNVRFTLRPLYCTPFFEWFTCLCVLQQLSLRSGLLLAVPNPNGAEGATMEAAIRIALQDADAAGIHGRDITPFLLKVVHS